MAKLSTHIRWQIVEKSFAGLSERQIAKHLGIIFKKYGCVKNFSSLHGRPRIFGCDGMKYLEVLLKEKVDWYIWELQSQMELWLGRGLELMESVNSIRKKILKLVLRHLRVTNCKIVLFICLHYYTWKSIRAGITDLARVNADHLRSCAYEYV